MSEPRKKFWKGNHSDHHLSNESGSSVTSGTEPSLHQPSPTGSSRGPSGLFRNLFSNTCSARRGGQSPNTASTMSNSIARDHSSNHPSSDLLPHTTQAADQHLIQDTNTGEVQPEPSDPKERIDDANEAIAGMKKFPTIVQNTASASNDVQSGLDAVDAFTNIVAPLKAFNSIFNAIADIHPYAKAVLSIFTYASKMILDQADRDDAVRDLLRKLSEVYTFLNEDGRLAKIVTMQELYGKVARQTLECADFVVHYSETKSAWERLAKNVFKETSAIIQSYNNVLDSLMQKFRDGAVRDILLDVRDINVKIHHIAEDSDFKDMVYVDGAGRDTSKCCLPGTREHILSEIQTWINSTGEDVERVFWLSGTAGKGKSAIAHTIADWFHERGGPSAVFCFDRTREAEQRHEKIFTTIARDLADHDPLMRRELASVVRDDNELRHTKDVMRQWKEFILRPADAASKAVAAPVLIVIDALDESGEARTWEQILRVLAGKLDTFSLELAKLPENIRVLVTSRPLDDIHKSLHDASHVRRVSMDDTSHVSTESSERDIQCYISTRLKHLQLFNDGDFKRLALKSDGLFQWAYLACEYIKGTGKMARPAMVLFEAVVAGTSGKGTRLLDDIYRRILEEIMPQDEHEELIPMFHSVMGQVLASLEPLSITALSIMQQHFPPAGEYYEVDQVVRPLGSLITGTTDSQAPIRPIHASFYDFLTDQSRSKMFYIDVSLAQRDLAFASLRVMKHGLRFNICSLESSYLPNSAIPDLEERVEDSISAELSYPCRFWGTHVSATSIEPSLVKEVEAFFDGERLLFWLEAVSLLKVVSGSVGTLSCIAAWLTGHAEYIDIADAVMDTQRFVRTCTPIILHSTPHLYLSALPLAPIQSWIFKTFAAKFPCTPRVVGGHVTRWPLMEKTLRVNPSIFTIAISRDGRYILCGDEGGTIHRWDMKTGETLSALVGHTSFVTSVAISPDGDRIVSGSGDKTIRVWDAGTDKALGPPLQGHTDQVWSVAISPDGKCIVSGSKDKTIGVWDMITGEALLAPLRGHTDGVISIAISRDGNRIVSGSHDRTVMIWCMGTGNVLGVPLQGHADLVFSVAFSPDGSYVASGSGDKTIRVWDTTTGKPLRVLQGHTDAIITVVISPGGNSIVSGSHDHMIRVWDAQTGEPLAMLQGHASTVSSVALSPDGNRIVSSSDDHTIRVWGADTSRAVTALLYGHTDAILSVAISADGNRIVSGSADNMVRVWDAYTGKEFGAPFQGHIGAVRSVAISMDGKLIVSGSSDKAAWMWDAMTSKSLGPPLQGHTNEVLCVAISPDGKRIASGSSDEMIRVWDVVTLQEFGEPLMADDGEILSVKFSLDGKRIVSASSYATIHMWDVVSGQTLGPPLQLPTCYDDDDSESAAISLDAKLVVLGAFPTLQIWDTENGEVLGTLQLEGDPLHLIPSVAISPDGHNIICSDDSERIWIWHMENGKALGAPLGPLQASGTVCSIAISPDGKRIVSGSYDKTIRVWDLELLIQSQFLEAPAILFSSNPTHTLCSASSFLQDIPAESSASSILQDPTSESSSSSVPQGLPTSSDSSVLRDLPSESSDSSTLQDFLSESSDSSTLQDLSSDSSDSSTLQDLPSESSDSFILQDLPSESSDSLIPNEEGWIVGPEGRLLLWVPASLYPVVHGPCNTLVIPGNGLQLDLSHFAHGKSWHKCREHWEEVGLSS